MMLTLDRTFHQIIINKSRSAPANPLCAALGKSSILVQIMKNFVSLETKATNSDFLPSIFYVKIVKVSLYPLLFLD